MRAGAALFFPAMVAVAVLQGCEDDTDCQYTDCLRHVGFVDKRPAWQQTSGGAVGVCALNASSEYSGLHCQFRKTYIVWGDGFGYEESMAGPCVTGPCVAGKSKVSRGLADLCVREKDGVLQGCLGDGDCQYADCVNHVGYVNRRPSWEKPTKVETVCAANASRGYRGNHCQYRETYTIFSEEVGFYEELVSVPCVVSPCVSQRYQVVAGVADLCLPCPSMPPPQPEYGEWLTVEYRCDPGEYLWGFNTSQDKECRRCPPGMVGRDGVKCEWCPGPLEEPYELDQSGCVCKAGAVMNRSGGCECRSGRRYNATTRGCELCPENTYGVSGGGCYECGGGTFAVERGVTVCEACTQGKYRVAGASGGCQACKGGTGNYAVHPWNETCVACNRSCDGRDGWMDGGPCPDGSAGFRVCVPCDVLLPMHGQWIHGGGCAYRCNAGYYFSEWDSGECVACSTSACPAGTRGRPCSEYEDRTCDTQCTNASKPVFYSKWVQRPSGAVTGDCPWECEDGYSARTTDYVLFQLHECLPSDLTASL